MLLAPREVIKLYTLLIALPYDSAHKSALGIGEAISKYLISHACNVVAVARSEEPLQKLQANAHDQVRYITGDLRDFTVAQKAVDLAVTEFGSLDGMVINHGVMTKASRLENSNLEEWKFDYDVNVFSAVAFVGSSTIRILLIRR